VTNILRLCSWEPKRRRTPSVCVRFIYMQYKSAFENSSHGRRRMDLFSELNGDEWQPKRSAIATFGTIPKRRPATRCRFPPLRRQQTVAIASNPTPRQSAATRGLSQFSRLTGTAHRGLASHVSCMLL